jgi:hypothetical protein
VDESIRTGHCTEKLTEEMKQIQPLDVLLAKDKTIRLRVMATAPSTESIAPEDEDLTSEQTKDNRKCSGEKHSSLNVTTRNHLIWFFNCGR